MSQRAINVEVHKRDIEDESRLIKRFMKKVQRSKVIIDFIETTRYKKKSEIKKERKRKGIKREKKRVLKQKQSFVEDKQ